MQLSDALFRLMLQVNYDQISIRALTDTAKVGYATFYRHFKSKDELLIHAMKEVLSDFEYSIHPDMSTDEEAVEFLRHIQRHRRAYMAAATVPRDHPVIHALQAYVAGILDKRYQVNSVSDVPFEVTVNHFVKSAYEFVHWYLENEDQYPLEKMAAAYRELVVDATEAAGLKLRQGQADPDIAAQFEERKRNRIAPQRMPSWTNPAIPSANR